MTTIKYPPSIKATAIERAVNGEPVSRVAKDIGVPTSTVSYWLKKHYFFRGDVIITKNSSINNPELEKVA